MIRKFVINEFRPQTSWDWRIAVDFYLAGIGAGLLLVSVALDVSVGSAIAIALVAVGSLIVLGHLGRPQHVWRAVSRVQSSWTSRGVVLANLVILFGLLTAAPHVFSGLPWSVGSWTKGNALGLVIWYIAAVSAVIFMFYPGFVLSGKLSIPFWNTRLLPLLFASYGVLGALAVTFVMLPTTSPALGPVSLARWGIVAVLVSALFTLVHLLTKWRSADAAARESVRWLLRGPLSAHFLLGVLVMGLALPLILLAVASSADEAVATPILVISGILILIGGLLMRFCVVKAGIFVKLV